ncbi:Crp/Fnr family transcriptional regulator [Hymenobacter terricola]|uniref:Crp/Fnr family transcriptional regulator n=1 Tax=Hymenobacter terricola TaxID=2819236 RepID=UPI001B30E1BC|nr:Crp/Fnr family transcriptional regulator [Hymenobacter terricola]
MSDEFFFTALPLVPTPAHTRLLRQVFTTETLAKGEPVLRAGQVCDRLYFVERGLLRHYLLHEGKEINTHFALPGTFATDYASLTSALPAPLTLEALVPTTLWTVRRADMLALYAQVPELEAVGRRLLLLLLAQQQQRLEILLRDSAAARCRYVQQHQPERRQAVPLRQLASYLGLSRETLSRVRGAR